MKKMNKKGFTLMEMLIVIAIIAILIAIAIPTFTSALEKSRQRTDMANVRSLKSLVIADYMSEGGVLAKDTANYKKNAQVCYLKTGGQDFSLSSDGCVELEAKWEGTDYEKGNTTRYIQLTIDTTDNGAISACIPEIPGVAS